MKFDINNYLGKPPNQEEIIADMIDAFRASDKRRYMLVGDKYYRVKNDILNRQMTRMTDKGPIVEDYKANNKLAHGTYKKQVDEKIGYLLSKPLSLDSEDKTYLEQLNNLLGKKFQYLISSLGYEATNKGIGWLHPYIDEQGNFKLMLIPSEQCIPIWKDITNTDLQAMIRVYEGEQYVQGTKKTVTLVQYYHENGIDYYRYDGGELLRDEPSDVHYYVGTEPRVWGRIPFVAFKNNHIEMSDIEFIKSLVDSYDLSRSDVANFIEEVKNLIYVLKGYGGTDLAEFIQDLNYFRAIKIDDPQDGGVDTLNPNMDVSAAQIHYEQLKRDIAEYGMSVNMDLDKMGSSPSGIALKFLYSSLDLKCNHMETEFRIGFENLLYFIDVYLAETGKGDYSNVEAEIIFNRDIAVNEEAAITMCQNSKDIISDRTIISNHPWVTDVDKELEELALQKQEAVKRQQEAFAFNDTGASGVAGGDPVNGQ